MESKKGIWLKTKNDGVLLFNNINMSQRETDKEEKKDDNQKTNNNLNNNNNISQNGMAKRIITVVSPDGQKYRDPNLRQSPTGLHDGSSKPLKRLNSNQIRLVRLVLTYDIKSTYCMSHKLAL